MPGVYVLSAECDDELTSLTIVGGLDIFGGLDAVTASLSGERGEQLVAEHTARCGSCRRWSSSPEPIRPRKRKSKS